MAHPGQLGEFLRSRRARLVPADVGLPADDGPRRVPGLRREELAAIAGVSASYYGRLEQGVSLNASPAVLDALAGALRLEPVEHEHLLRLGGAVAPAADSSARPGEVADAATLQLLDAVADTPALIQDRRFDVLAWNALGHALLAAHLQADAPLHPTSRPNLARLLFCDAHTRELWTDWERKTRAVVAGLRTATVTDPGDSRLTALIGELSQRSETFAALWASHDVFGCEVAAYRLAHPLVGALELTQQTFGSAASPGQTLVVMTTAPGSPSRDALRLLAGTLT